MHERKGFIPVKSSLTDCVFPRFLLKIDSAFLLKIQIDAEYEKMFSGVFAKETDRVNRSGFG